MARPTRTLLFAAIGFASLALQHATIAVEKDRDGRRRRTASPCAEGSTSSTTGSTTWPWRWSTRRGAPRCGSGSAAASRIRWWSSRALHRRGLAPSGQGGDVGSRRDAQDHKGHVARHRARRPKVAVIGQRPL